MKFDSKQLKDMSDAVRAGALYAVRVAQSGHIGIVLGAADIVTTIFANHMRRGSDKFVLSAGHGSALLYSVLKLSGHKIPALKTFRKLGGLPGHPEMGIDGVAATTGPLGQGVANAIGIAMAQKIKRAREIKKSDGFIYCLCSDGDLMEGVAQEAIGFAGRYKLNNIILLWDDNKISIDGNALTDLDIPGRMRAAGWDVLSVNGNDFADVNYALTIAKQASRPVFIQCTTVLGLGSSVAGTAAAHAYDIMNEELIALEEKFTNTNGLKLWGKVAKRLSSTNKSEKYIKHHVSTDEFFVSDDNMSTRDLSGRFISFLMEKVPDLLVGGSADLGVSTKTKTLVHRDIIAGDFSGNFINYGVREHAMAAIMNGLCIAGLRPYGGTFLAFSDYMRAAMRLSAISKLPVIYVFSHDSIAVGEDGPTHQAVEQLASLRLMPNMNVFRPCNVSEVIASWEMAITETSRPSCIILSRQKFKQICSHNVEDIKRGGYIIRASKSKRPKITLIATGSEVSLAVEVSKSLCGAQVVSMPSVEKFREQPADYKSKILAGSVIVIEAGASSSWFEFADIVIGLDEFGESGPGDQVYKSFGFDAATIVNAITRVIK